MNLLPPEYKKELRYEAWRQFTLFSGIALASVITITIVLLLPSFFFVSFQLQASKDRLTFLQRGPDFKELAASRDQINAIDAFLKNIVDYSTKRGPIVPVVQSVLAETATSTKLSSFAFSRKEDGASTITLAGVADRRDDLLKFIDKLQKNSYVKRVDSPVTNYLKEISTPFALTLDIAL
ncbi:MAG: hypothetical protein HYT34_01730 [Candidatus Ryanbacteria bacterium]|nr:hypothetical protein [Candidatus Ryanbacteria bacterium]